MKAKLLKKCRREVELLERNGEFRVYIGDMLLSFGDFDRAIRVRRREILKMANDIFGFQSKNEL